MPIHLRGFGSKDIFTLIVGPEQQELYVPRPILDQIPFFGKALKDNAFKEAEKKIFELPEDDPNIVADVLGFVLADHIKPIETNKNSKISDQQRAEVTAYIKAFVAADKFMAEQTANRLIDRIVEYHQVCVVDPGNISALSIAGLQDSSMYEFLVKQIAYNLRSRGPRSYSSTELLDANFEHSEAMFMAMSSADLTTVLKYVVKVDDRDYTSPAQVLIANRTLCSLHTHQLTDKCLSRS